MHLSNFPERSWSVILQQAWSICLCDKIRRGSSEHDGWSPHNGKYKKVNCKCFNKGTCTAGGGCKYDHRCDKCGKWGHGAHICRSKKSANNNHSKATSSLSGQEQ